MKRLGLLAVLLAGIVLLAVGCSENCMTPLAPTPPSESTLDPQSAAYELASAAGWTFDSKNGGPAQTSMPGGSTSVSCLVRLERQVITQNIVHYTWHIRTGRGPHDMIGLHRVVRETHPYQPVRTSLNFFFQHGCCKNFVGMMLPGLTSPTTSDDFGLAVYLARHGVDVWGIDQAWTLVPQETADLSFMADWGMARQSKDLRTAITLARTVRILTGCGGARMVLAGYSNGVYSSVAVVNEETQIPGALRQVGAYVPIDCPIKANQQVWHDFMMGYIEGYYRPEYEAGVYAEPITFSEMAHLVRCCPNDPSPFYPDLTNEQYALVATCAPWFVTPESAFHYWGAYFDETGMPTGLRYTGREMWLDFLASGVAYEPMVWGLEWMSYSIDLGDSPYDDHLGAIRVPILNLTPNGGAADVTAYGMSLLGSADKQTLMPSVGTARIDDIGHIDIFTYPGAEQLVWEPLLQWLETHSGI